jgi:hypothetical protein
MKFTRKGSVGLPWARAAFLLLLVACGSRTGLFGTDLDDTDTTDDAGVRTTDASARFDTGIPGFDSGDFDALPPIDATPPRDANRTDCPDADATLIYIVTDSNELYSFFPPDQSFVFISNLACPSNGATPFSMAVDRKGVALVEFTDQNLYRVSTATGACIGTPYVPNQQGFGQFGMGYATNDIGPVESLFVAGTRDTMVSPVSPGLGRIDSTTFALTKIGNFVPDIAQAELTGTGDGRLFAFYTKNPATVTGPPSYIGEIDTNTAHVIAETAFPTVDQGNGWAFAFWGGDFYMFTSPNGGSSDVTRYRPSDGTVNVVATLPATIVGAGVSTCAPAQ